MSKFKIGDKVHYKYQTSNSRLIGVVVGFRSRPPVAGLLLNEILVNWSVDGIDPIPYYPEDLRLVENGIQRAKRIINV